MIDNLEIYKLSDDYTIYIKKYDGDYKKEDFIKRIMENKSVINPKNISKVENRVFIQCNELRSIDNFILNTSEIIINKKINKYAKSSWVYTQKKDFNMVMHKHDYLHYSVQKTKLKTEWTSVFYVQIPKNIKDGEGDIIFMTEDKNFHRFKPKENHIIFFSGTLNHMVTPIPNAETERIVYASNFNFNLK